MSPLTTAPASTRMRADERREQVLEAAMPVFARHGYDGTSTEEVAKAAGISQPYLFRLFATKRALFIELVARGFERVGNAFVEAARGRSGQEALEAMADAYLELLADRDLLLVQLHAYSACEDPEVRAATQREFSRLWQVVGDAAGLPSVDLVDFFAHGMLLNVMAALDASDLRDAWVRACLTKGL
jgi:AcrR family transcriptional regulator